MSLAADDRLEGEREVLMGGQMSPLDPRYRILGNVTAQCNAQRTIPHR